MVMVHILTTMVPPFTILTSMIMATMVVILVDIMEDIMETIMEAILDTTPIIHSTHLIIMEDGDQTIQEEITVITL